MAKEIDLTGITAGVQQANRGSRQYAEDILKDKRDDQFNQSFVKPFVQETFFDGPERRRKEQIELQMRSPELINQTIKEINEKFLGSEKKRLLDARLGQGYFRKQILSRVDGDLAVKVVDDFRPSTIIQEDITGISTNAITTASLS